MNDAAHPRPPRLLAEFPVPAPEQWRAEVERLLKGVPFARAMLTRTLEGITLEPMPTAADTTALPWLATLPGQAPFIRGAYPGGYHEAPWLVAQEIPLSRPTELNAALRHDLARGQSAVNLVVAPEARSEGTRVADRQDLATILAGIDLQHVPVFIEAGAAARQVAGWLADLYAESGVDLARVRGGLGCDPVAGLAGAGRLPVPLDELYDQAAALTAWAADKPGVRTLPVREEVWHEGGADHALSLGLTLSGALHVLREMESRGLAPAETARRIVFQVAVDTDFFMSLAKLRALRLLWSGIQRTAGLPPAPAVIHARTSRRMMAAWEPYPNLLRVTTAAMAAVLGGVDSLHTGCFDEALGPPDEFSRRIARNVQLILAHEVHLDHVTDPAGGAWYPEKLTADLAAAAWEHTRAVEEAGGIVAALETGRVQEQIGKVAAERAARLATGRDAMVGVNRFVDPEARPLDAQPTAPDSQTEQDDQEPGGDGVEPITLRRDAAPFEAVRARVRAAGDQPAVRVFCACLGDPARYMPRLDFVRGFFQVGGFTVLAEGFGRTAAEAAAAATAAQAATVVLVGQDETYAELAADTARLLQDLDPPPRIILAGKPGALEDELRAAGVGEFLHARSDMLDVLGRMAAGLEVAP